MNGVSRLNAISYWRRINYKHEHFHTKVIEFRGKKSK